MQFSFDSKRPLLVFSAVLLLMLVVFRLLVTRFVNDTSVANTISVWLLGFALVALLAGLLIGWAGYRRHGNRMNRMQQIVDDLTGGHYHQQGPTAPPSGNDNSLENSMRQLARILAEREQLLQENLTRMNAVLGSMIEGVIATDHRGIVLMANDAAPLMLSRTREELVGHRLLDTVRYTELSRVIEQARETGEPRTAELETTATPRRHIQASVTALSDPAGGGLAIVLHDVTELRKMETMRRDFVTNVSHELKTPLASIKASAETLRLGALHDNDVNTEFVKQIEDQSDLLEQQVQRLFELSHAQSGEDSLNIERIEVNRICQTIVQQFMGDAKRRSVELILELHEQPLVIRSDENAIHSILRNLISNALRYTRAEGSVVVRTARANRQIEISVSDNGIGIPAAEKERVFERFYRVDTSRSRDHGGTGLGLAIVKHLVESVGGRIDLTSQIGKGSTFRIFLPDGE